MAEFNSYLLGKAKKSVGNITLCYTKRKNIARAKVFSRKDNPTPEVLVQRAKLGGAGWSVLSCRCFAKVSWVSGKVPRRMLSWHAT